MTTIQTYLAAAAKLDEIFNNINKENPNLIQTQIFNVFAAALGEVTKKYAAQWAQETVDPEGTAKRALAAKNSEQNQAYTQAPTVLSEAEFTMKLVNHLSDKQQFLQAEKLDAVVKKAYPDFDLAVALYNGEE